MIAVHANRFILFKVFEDFKTVSISNDNLPGLLKKIPALVDLKFKKLYSLVENKFPDSYPGNIFKNTERQTELSAEVV